jgi:hypothetical protein
MIAAERAQYQNEIGHLHATHAQELEELRWVQDEHDRAHMRIVEAMEEEARIMEEGARTVEEENQALKVACQASAMVLGVLAVKILEWRRGR